MKTKIELAADCEDWESVMHIAKEYIPSKCWSDRNIRSAYDRVLIIAAKKNKTDIFATLLNAGACPESARDCETGHYAIHYAVINRNTDILSFLSNNNNLKLKNKAGKTAVELAAELEYWELVILFDILESDFSLMKSKTQNQPDRVYCKAVSQEILNINLLKKTYQANVRFFSFRTNEIFNGNNINSIIQKLRNRSKDNNGASEKTLRVFGLC